MSNVYTRKALAHALCCCERTIHRATMNGDLVPCSATPPQYNESDVLDMLNSSMKGGARKLDKLPSDLVNTSSLAKAVAVSPATVRRWYRACNENGLPLYRMSKSWVLFCVEDVCKWMKKQADEAERKRIQKIRSMSQVGQSYKALVNARKSKGVK